MTNWKLTEILQELEKAGIRQPDSVEQNIAGRIGCSYWGKSNVFSHQFFSLSYCTNDTEEWIHRVVYKNLERRYITIDFQTLPEAIEKLKELLK